MQGKSPVAHRRFAFLSLLALGSCDAGHALAEPTFASPANVAAQEVQRGVSLVLTVDDTDLAVGDELSFHLAFRNASGDAAVVVPPLDGSWSGMRQPAYELVFADAKGQPLPHALGFATNARCGLTNPIEPKDRRVLGARSKLEIEDAHAWAPPFSVLDHARPGVVSLRV
ncbi:MAG TPA: hypothetical protein VM694_41085, partial [Polyangium sp.]|nr:hypothetical protein [Polyangium sp.]